MTLPGVRPGHSARTRILAILIGIIVALVLVVGNYTLGRSVTSCSLGNEVGSAWIWSTSILVNVPDGGGAAWSSTGMNYTFQSGSLQVGALSTVASTGNSELMSNRSWGFEGVYGLAEWGMFAVRNVTSFTGANDPCSQPYVAELLAPLNCGGAGNLSSILPLQNNASDAVEPHTVPSELCDLAGVSPTPGAQFWFDESYHSADLVNGTLSGSISLCGWPKGGSLNITVSGIVSYPIAVSMPHNGGTIRSVGEVVWRGGFGVPYAPARYSLPGGWNWSVSTIAPGTLPTLESPGTNSLLAFERLSCAA